MPTSKYVGEPCLKWPGPLFELHEQSSGDDDIRHRRLEHLKNQKDRCRLYLHSENGEFQYEYCMTHSELSEIPPNLHRSVDYLYS